jgi:hypothetical protein
MKKKVVVPKSTLMWRRKVVPNVISSQASQEGGCGEIGRQVFKKATKRDAVVDIMPPFRADPPALRTTFFEGGRMMRIMRAP